LVTTNGQSETECLVLEFALAAELHEPRDGEGDARQPVYLFDGVLGHPTARQSQPLTDRVDRQRGGSNNAEGGIGQRQDPLGVHVTIEQAGQEAVHFREAEGLGRLHRLPRESCCVRRDSPIVGSRQPRSDVRHNAKRAVSS
jgi:hypothetical protein